MKNTIDIIVVGAGHAGISTSYYLKQNEIPHLVIEKGTIGSSWKNLRWDSFCLNTPNWMNSLPGDFQPVQKDENFFTKNEYVDYLISYAEKNNLPIQENTTVTSVDKDEKTRLFSVGLTSEKKSHIIYCKSVIIASGILNVPKISGFGNKIESRIKQLHASEYRNPSKLPKGAVLVVGGGQSGAQITEDLLNAGRKVYLSTSKVGRVPRRYRGKDFTEWFDIIDHFSEKTSSLSDPSSVYATNPLMSGVGHLGHTISLQYLRKKGAILLGRFKDSFKDRVVFDNTVQEHINYADTFYKKVKTFIDEIIEIHHIDAELHVPDHFDMDFNEPTNQAYISELGFNSNDISSIIWSTGFTGNFKWINLPVLDEQNMPIHDRGNSKIPGLFFIGFPWLRSRQSGIVYGMKEEGKITVNQVLKHLNKAVNLTASIQYT